MVFGKFSALESAFCSMGGRGSKRGAGAAWWPSNLNFAMIYAFVKLRGVFAYAPIPPAVAGGSEGPAAPGSSAPVGAQCGTRMLMVRS